jgi:valyl-tRNA synthetase
MILDKTYNPKSFEDDIYKEWIDKKYFSAKVNPNKKPFTLVSPPPNVTSKLHIGHAMNLTLQDILIRYKRMQGFEALWIQGTDHAAIATEVKIIEKLKNEEHTTKEQLGRVEFMKRVHDWYDSYNGVIYDQFKKMGISADWDRPAFTMDKRCSGVVRQVFANLYDKGLIYKGDRIINWCPSCKTALSDAEIEYEENKGNLWHLRYDIVGSDKYLTLATTRPETLFGDSAVAVNPTDERYKDLVGKEVIIPIINKKIPIISDDYVEKDFGTGVVKITPAHDPNDFNVGIRHNLPIIKIMNNDGTMNELCGKYAGLDRYVARKQLVEDLKSCGKLIKIEPYTNNVAHCYRCHNVVEPMISKQWFVKMKPLAEPAIKAVKDGEIKFHPDRMKKVYFHWLENINDWCISRQLWSGHRIPVYTCKDCGKMFASSEEVVNNCKYCKSTNIKQEDDVLDTWFSSALWPFSTLNYLENSKDYNYFYPSDVNVTAYDIIFFWVSRMIMMGLEETGKVPFRNVLMHGLVRDNLGRKMSKSLGNGVDPLIVIDKYGTDALRYSLINGITIGGDTRYSDDRTVAAAAFINKIWNASKFVLMNCDGVDILPLNKCNLTIIDKWMLNELNEFIKNFNKRMEKYDFGLCATLMQDFFWGTFCDYYIELSKPNLEKDKQSSASVLYYVLDKLLKLMHPFIPFVTEKIYKAMGHNDTIMLQEYPKFDKKLSYKDEDKNITSVINLIKSIRNARINKGIADNIKVSLFVLPLINKELLNDCLSNIQKLSTGSSIQFIDNENEAPKDSIVAISELAKVYIPTSDFINVDEEKERLNKELLRLQGELDRSKKMLSNQGFISKAPTKLIEEEKEKQT